MASAAPTLMPQSASVSNGAAADGRAETTANPPAAKRARQSKPKVKTGCNNCKLRRIKCGEQRPECSQCVKSRKECPGYPAPNRSARPHEVVMIAPKPVALAAHPPQALALAPRAPLAGPPITPVQLPPKPPRRTKKEILRIEREKARAGVQAPRPPAAKTPHDASLTLFRPSSTLPLQEQEGLYFQLFRSHTARELSGFFDSVFWTQTVLRECHSEPAIRYAVVALGALYKTLEQSSASPPNSPTDHPSPSDSPVYHWQVAVKQYSEAIGTVVVLSSQSHRSPRVLLMASVLLACFDSFVGDHRQAINHIQNGLRLLEQVRGARQRSFVPGTPEPVEDELVQMFTRLAIQAKSYDMAFHFPQPYVIRLTAPSSAEQPGSPLSDSCSTTGASIAPHPSIPPQFGTLLEARLSWDGLCERMLRFTESLFNASSKDGPMGVLPRALRQYGSGFKDELEAWSDAFQHILDRRNSPSVSFQEKAGIAVLKMFQIMGQILLLMTFSDSESAFDIFEPQFKTIVDLALEVVGDEERRAAARRCPDLRRCMHRNPAADFSEGHEYVAYHVKPSFSADLGIVPPLYVVATKCRNHVVRRQAIHLLRSSSRREAMWDSQLSARIGDWVSWIEEDDDGAHHQPQQLPSPATAMVSPEMPHDGRRASSAGSLFGEDVALGPGGNARWDRRGTPGSTGPGRKRSVPEERRVMVRSVDFDLRARFARLSVGTRGINPNAPDLRSRQTSISW